MEPYFPPYLINKTTSVARRTSSFEQPHYLIYYMKGRSKIRQYDVATSGVPVETLHATSLQTQTCPVNAVETQNLASLQTQRAASTPQRCGLLRLCGEVMTDKGGYLLLYAIEM
jgi:hypothetical protein